MILIGTNKMRLPASKGTEEIRKENDGRVT